MKALCTLIAMVFAVTVHSGDLAEKLNAPESSDFEDGSVQGWSWAAGYGDVYNPGYLSDNCLRSRDRSSPPFSHLIAPDRYHGDWSRWVTYAVDGDICPGYVEYDYRVLNDGWVTETRDVYPSFWIAMDFDDLDQRIVARYSPVDPVQEDGGPNDGWHHLRAPFHPIAPGDPLPGDVNGQWIMIAGTDDDWNDLLRSVEYVYFIIDIAQSPYRSEQFLIDNFRLVSKQI